MSTLKRVTGAQWWWSAILTALALAVLAMLVVIQTGVLVLATVWVAWSIGPWSLTVIPAFAAWFTIAYVLERRGVI